MAKKISFRTWAIRTKTGELLDGALGDLRKELYVDFWIYATHDLAKVDCENDGDEPVHLQITEIA